MKFISPPRSRELPDYIDQIRWSIHDKQPHSIYCMIRDSNWWEIYDQTWRRVMPLFESFEYDDKHIK